MKRVIGLALAFALTLSTAPAVAEDAFHAFSTLPATPRATLTPLGDDQLASIEGASHWNATQNGAIDIDIGINVAITTQLNICALCRDVTQGNAAVITESIRF